MVATVTVRAPPALTVRPSVASVSPSEDLPGLTRPLVPQAQFEFALTAVAEEVNAILKALPQ